MTSDTGTQGEGSGSAALLRRTPDALVAALRRIVEIVNDPDRGFVETIEEVHAVARMALDAHDKSR